MENVEDLIKGTKLNKGQSIMVLAPLGGAP